MSSDSESIKNRPQLPIMCDPCPPFAPADCSTDITDWDCDYEPPEIDQTSDHASSHEMSLSNVWRMSCDILQILEAGPHHATGETRTAADHDHHSSQHTPAASAPMTQELSQHDQDANKTSSCENQSASDTDDAKKRHSERNADHDDDDDDEGGVDVPVHFFPSTAKTEEEMRTLLKAAEGLSRLKNSE